MRSDNAGFRLETHLHTSEGSACADLDAVSQVRQYKEAGYDGVIVTDHFVTGNSAVDRILPWRQQMKDQFEGYRKAAEEGKKIGLKVFCGIEFGYHGTEFVVIGLDDEWFADHSRILNMRPEDSLTLFRKAGAAIIHAHPFRQASYISKVRLYPDYVDAVEIYNHQNKPEWDDRAEKYARMSNLPVTSGSDCHRLGEIGGGIILDRAPEDEKDLISIIKSGRGWTLIRRRDEW